MILSFTFASKATHENAGLYPNPGTLHDFYYDNQIYVCDCSGQIILAEWYLTINACCGKSNTEINGLF